MPNSVQCTSSDSYPKVKLNWMVDGNKVDYGIRSTVEYTEMGGTYTVTDIEIIPDIDATAVTVSCEVDGHDVSEEIEIEVKPRCWMLLKSDRFPRDWSIPSNMEFVDVNENNFKSFLPYMKHLVNDAAAVELIEGLIGFARSKEEHCLHMDGNELLKILT